MDENNIPYDENTEGVEISERYSIRYSELLVFIMNHIVDKNTKLETRIKTILTHLGL